MGVRPRKSFVSGVSSSVTDRRAPCPFWDGELTDSRIVTRLFSEFTETISPTIVRLVAAGTGDGTRVG
jgi:hypothetical protein